MVTLLDFCPIPDNYQYRPFIWRVLANSLQLMSGAVWSRNIANAVCLGHRQCRTNRCEY
ncbi:hypothetical protein EMIT053CA3_90133 [Pseudomonas donghuensis]